VPGLEPSRVVITDQRGVSLVAADTGGTAGAIDARLQVKRDVEEYMTQKIVHLLDSAFGAGQAIVSVDASLNFDATKTTTQDLLPAENADGSGRVVRRRQVTGSSTAQPVWTNATEAAAAPKTPSSTVEVEYEYGRRIDEVIAAPGALTRLNVGVIVPGELTEEKRVRITDLVRVAAGIDIKRGDAVSVQPLSQIGSEPELDQTSNAEEVVPSGGGAPQVTPASTATLEVRDTVIMGALIGLVIAVLGGLIVSRIGRRSFSAQEREELLTELRKSLSTGAPVTGRAHP
jgi:flagellar M-ring protein FliF